MWQVYWKREWTSALCCCWLHACLWRLQQQRWRCATWEREKLHWVFVDPGSMNEWTRTGVWTEKAAGADCGQSNFTRALCKVALRRKSIHWAAALKARGRFFLVIPLLHRSSFTNRRCSVNPGRIFFFLSRVHTATGHLEHSPSCSCASLVVRPALTLVRVHRGMLFVTLFRAFAVIWTALCSPPSRSSSVSALRFRGARPWEWEENENVLIKHFFWLISAEPSTPTHGPARSWSWCGERISRRIVCLDGAKQVDHEFSSAQIATKKLAWSQITPE